MIATQWWSESVHQLRAIGPPKPTRVLRQTEEIALGLVFFVCGNKA